jgi:hypothetical protein
MEGGKRKGAACSWMEREWVRGEKRCERKWNREGGMDGRESGREEEAWIRSDGGARVATCGPRSRPRLVCERDWPAGVDMSGM